MWLNSVYSPNVPYTCCLEHRFDLTVKLVLEATGVQPMLFLDTTFNKNVVA